MNRTGGRRLTTRILLALASVAALVAVPAVSASADDPTYSISGTVLMNDGSIPQFGSINVYGDDPTTPVSSAPINYDGSFTVPGLPDGNYRIEASADQDVDTWYNGAADYVDAAIVPVADADVSGIAMTLYPVTYSIQGTVTGDTPTAPLAGQTVELWGQGDGDSPMMSTVTDDAGHYSFTGLAADEGLQLHFVGGDGWAQQWWQNEYAEWTSTLIDDQSNPTMNVTLVRTGTINGRVTVYGHPTEGLAGADVTATMPDGYTYVGDSITDSNGYYTITGIPAGQFKVSAVGPDYPDLGTQSAWAQTWFGGYERVGFGTLVRVPAHSGASNVNIAIQPDSKVTGTVTDAQTGHTFDIAGLNLTTTSGTVLATTYVDSNGHYQFDAVPPGTYKVHVFSNQRDFDDYNSDVEDWYGGMDVSAAKSIRVTADRTTAGINIALKRGGTFTGQISEPFDYVPTATAELFTTNGQLVQTGPIYNGQYGFLADPGTYIVRILAQDGYYASQYYRYADSMSTATRITISATSDITLPNISLGYAVPGTIHGNVVSTDGTPVVGMTITANRYPTTYYAEATPAPVHVAADGTFTMQNVPAGQYTIQYGDGEVGPDGYHNRYNGGAVVTVSAGQTLSLATQTVTQTGQISGTITDGGQPAYFAQAEVYTLGGTLVTSAITDENGNYTANVPAGKYRIRFFEGPDQSWGATWLGGGQSFAGSQIFDTSVSSEADGTLVPGSTITGKAVDATNRLPIDNLTVIVFRQLPDGTWYQADGGDAGTDGSGTYTVSGLSTGTYILQFSDTVDGYPTYQTSYDGKSTTMTGAQKVVVNSIGQVVTAPVAYVLRVNSSTYAQAVLPPRVPTHAPAPIHGSSLARRALLG